MATEGPYRLAFAVIVVATGMIAGYHRWKAKSGEPISHQDEGCLFAVVLRSLGLVVWLSVLVYLLWPESMHWAQLPLSPAMRWSGAAMGAVAVGLLFWTLRSLGKNLTDTVVVRKAATLVTSGPYRWVRHPFYVTVALLGLAATSLSANWLIGVTGFAVLSLLAIRTRKEEQRLIERFGDDYRRYVERTGRFFPRLS
jgi:protein-S-isoprenylcysteine O-methyltransferase Ste14